MGNSIAECGTLEKIKGLLKGIIEKLNFEGKVIISYKDFSLTDNQNHKEYHKNNYHNNMYCGITRLKLKYKDEYSKIKEYCYIDRTTLYKILNENRLTFIYEGFENGWNYTIWQKL